jgi:hypothetical protein
MKWIASRPERAARRVLPTPSGGVPGPFTKVPAAVEPEAASDQPPSAVGLTVTSTALVPEELVELRELPVPEETDDREEPLPEETEESDDPVPEDTDDKDEPVPLLTDERDVPLPEETTEERDEPLPTTWASAVPPPGGPNAERAGRMSNRTTATAVAIADIFVRGEGWCMASEGMR